MPKSRVIAILSLFVLSAILTACGTDDDAAETVEPTATRVPITATATATETEATPQTSVRTPVVMQATPTTVAVRAATPMPAVSTPVVAAPVVQTPVTMPVQATFMLGGVEQQDYLITDEGCVGLGDWRGLKPGAQVIVRDASGTVVDVGELEAGDNGDECSWMADLSVPESEFVSISVPMITDVWFSQSDLSSGMVEIILP